MVAWHILSRVSHMVMRIRTVMVNHGAGLCPPCLDDQQSIFLPWFFCLSSGINDANFTSKVPLFLAPDIDECYTENECHQNATCNNTKGSYSRTCKGGFMGDGELNAQVRFSWTAYLIIKVRVEHFFLSKRSFQQHLSEFVWQNKNFQFHLLSFVSLSSLPKPFQSRDLLISFKSEFHSLLEKSFFFPRRFRSAELRL